jgi:myo-inositol 2-dehydrogenase / D-chiro-inositol 1-dehydrogenase
VIAASTPDEQERRWAAENLEGVKIYSNYDEMIEKEDLQAVVIASVTAVHAEQTLKAINKGYHVLCEKPLSINVEIVSNFELLPIRDAYACNTDQYLL